MEVKTKSMEIIYSLNSLKTSLEDLYSEKIILGFVIHYSDLPYSFTVSLKGEDGNPDCIISSFNKSSTKHIWAQTETGKEKAKHTSLTELQRGLIKENITDTGKIEFYILNGKSEKNKHKFRLERRIGGQGDMHFIDADNNRIASVLKNPKGKRYTIIPYFIKTDEIIKVDIKMEAYVKLRELLRKSGFEDADFQ